MLHVMHYKENKIYVRKGHGLLKVVIGLGL